MLKRNDNAQHHSIMIVDDHPIIRRGLTEMINVEPELSVTGEAGSAEDALKFLERASALPDLIIIDVDLGIESGLELIKQIRKRYPKVQLLAISMHEENLYAERALRAGARGYIMKEHAAEQFLVAIRRILAGDIYLSQAMHQKMLRAKTEQETVAEAPLIATLSDRELEVFRLIGMGLTCAEIAQKYNRSIKAIEANRASARDKLGLKTTAELTHLATRWVNPEV